MAFDSENLRANDLQWIGIGASDWQRHSEIEPVVWSLVDLISHLTLSWNSTITTWWRPSSCSNLFDSRVSLILFLCGTKSCSFFSLDPKTRTGKGYTHAAEGGDPVCSSFGSCSQTAAAKDLRYPKAHWLRLHRPNFPITFVEPGIRSTKSRSL